jgi:hypothetical protein
MDLTNWRTSKKRLIACIENELKFHCLSMEWLSRNIPYFDDFKNAFAQSESYKQAHSMHDGINECDRNFLFFFNVKKLNGNPLVLESKAHYSSDDIFILCHKTGYPFAEMISMCSEDPIFQRDWDKMLQGLESGK